MFGTEAILCLSALISLQRQIYLQMKEGSETCRHFSWKKLVYSMIWNVSSWPDPKLSWNEFITCDSSSIRFEF